MIFRFYDTGLKLTGSAAGTISEVLTDHYSSFWVDDEHPVPEQIVHAVVRTVTGGVVCLLRQGNRTVCRLPPLAPLHLAEILVRRVLAQVRSHLLFHGAALGRHGQGLILAGPSGSGKTTLSLFLRSQGYALLSDETSAVARESGLLNPFPRRLPLKTSGKSSRIRAAGERAAVVPLRYLFVLHGAGAVDCQTLVLCGAMPAALAAAVARIMPEAECRAETAYGLPGFVWKGRMAPAQFQRLALCCEQHGVAVLDVLEETGPTTFSHSPRLQPVRISQSALALLRHLQNGFRSSLLQNLLDENPALLYALVARRLTGVACYRLRVGPPAKTSALIGQVVGRP